MTSKDLKDQPRLLEKAPADATEAERRRALDGTIGDTQAFCWAALRQFDRRESTQTRSTPKEFGLRHADLHLLLLVAEEAVAQVVWVEKLLCTVGEPQTLPPDEPLRRSFEKHATCWPSIATAACCIGV